MIFAIIVPLHIKRCQVEQRFHVIIGPQSFSPFPICCIQAFILIAIQETLHHFSVFVMGRQQRESLETDFYYGTELVPLQCRIMCPNKLQALKLTNQPIMN